MTVNREFCLYSAGLAAFDPIELKLGTQYLKFHPYSLQYSSFCVQFLILIGQTKWNAALLIAKVLLLKKNSETQKNESSRTTISKMF